MSRSVANCPTVVTSVPWSAVDYRSRSRRLPRKPCRARRLQAGARWVPGRDGYPDGEAAPILASQGSHRRQAEGALLSLADKTIEVMKAALAANDTNVAEWVVDRHSKPGSPTEKSARMRDEEARAELERQIAIVAAELEQERLEEERASEAGQASPSAGEGRRPKQNPPSRSRLGGAGFSSRRPGLPRAAASSLHVDSAPQYHASCAARIARFRRSRS